VFPFRPSISRLAPDDNHVNQVELAMLEYRLTRGPRATGDLKDDKGCGFRGPGESKVETDKRLIRDRIVLLQVRVGGIQYP